MTEPGETPSRSVRIPVGASTILADLSMPPGAVGWVLFAHGSGSGRKSPRNVFVAHALARGGIGSLLVDLLTESEAREDERTTQFRFDIPLLADRLVGALDWARSEPATQSPVGLYGASTGGAAAMIAAARRPDTVRALVLRGARSDLAQDWAPRVRVPVLFLVGSRDRAILEVNERTARELR